MSAISDIVDEIESNKDKMGDAANELEQKSGVVEAWQMGGRLHVKLHEGNEYHIPKIESHYDVTHVRTSPDGVAHSPDRQDTAHIEAEFKN